MTIVGFVFFYSKTPEHLTKMRLSNTTIYKFNPRSSMTIVTYKNEETYIRFSDVVVVFSPIIS